MQLRAIETADIDALSAWLPATASVAGCERWSTLDGLQGAVETRGVVVGIDGNVQSFVEFETGSPRRDAACVRFLAVPSGMRRRGTGHRTALALEQRLARSIRSVYVQIPERLGLGLYFWLRLGYRPLTQRDWPAHTDSSIWMARELR